jgi:DNA-binding NtrC family response regulator
MQKKDFKVMVVDDEVDIAQGMAENLEMITGHSFDFFSDPYLALQAFKNKSYNLVLTDISMPNIDGFEMMKRMRARRPTTFFIVITAHKTIEMVTRSMRLGASYIFYKPVDLAGLEDAIETLVGRYLYWIGKIEELRGTK